MHGEIRVVDDVAPAFADAVAEAWHARPGRGFSIALCGGETARRCYAHLAAAPASPVDWMATEVYWADERCVPLDHPDSNYRLAAEALLERVAGVHALFPMRAEDGADAYQMQLSTIGALDVVHLDLGADGHVAGLFPDSPALDADPGRWITTNEDPRGVHPHPRLTLTFTGIARGRRVIVTASGPDRAQAFAAVRRDAALPATRVHGADVVWIADRDASGDAG